MRNVESTITQYQAEGNVVTVESTNGDGVVTTRVQVNRGMLRGIVYVSRSPTNQVNEKAVVAAKINRVKEGAVCGKPVTRTTAT